MQKFILINTVLKSSRVVDESEKLRLLDYLYNIGIGDGMQNAMLANDTLYNGDIFAFQFHGVAFTLQLKKD